MIWKSLCHQPGYHLHSNCFRLVYTYERVSVCNHTQGFHNFTPDTEQISEPESSICPYQIGFDRDLTSFQFHDTCCFFLNFQRLPFENSDVNKYFVLSFKPTLESSSKLQNHNVTIYLRFQTSRYFMQTVFSFAQQISH